MIGVRIATRTLPIPLAFPIAGGGISSCAWKSQSQSQFQLGRGGCSSSISRELSWRRRTRMSSSASNSAEGGGNGERVGDELKGSSTTQEGNNDDVLVQYVVLRRDLIDTWPMGSVVTQGCHASVAAIWEHKDDPHTLLYCSPPNLHSMHKVTLEVKGEPQIVNLSEKLKAGGILHTLWIEQPENYPTCLATKPYPKSLVSPLFKKLKLCK